MNKFDHQHKEVKKGYLQLCLHCQQPFLKTREDRLYCVRSCYLRSPIRKAAQKKYNSKWDKKNPQSHKKRAKKYRSKNREWDLERKKQTAIKNRIDSFINY